MSSKFSKSLVLAIAVLFVATSLALAQSRPGTGSTGTPSTTGERQPMGSSTTGTQSQMGTTDARDAIFATVTEVNKSEEMVSLRMQNGETVELQVPQQLLSELNQGDSVQVSIRKTAGQPGTGGGMQPSQPGTGTGTTRPPRGQ